MNTDTTVAGQYAGKVFNTNADGSPNFASVGIRRRVADLVAARTGPSIPAR